MAEATWLLQDSPIFWFTNPSVVRLGGLTSYETGIFPGIGVNEEDVALRIHPEQQQKIWRGDRRYYRRPTEPN